MPAHTITPPPYGTLFTMLTSANGLSTQRHTHGLWLDMLPISQKHWRRLMVAHSVFWQQLWWTCLHSACHCTVPQIETSVSLCYVTKLHVLEWLFIVSSTRCTCVMIMLFNQLIDMPHLSGGWIILEKEKCSLTGM
jgi:hypothetical protein